MERGTDKELFRVEEWSIENFSCWNREIHDHVITTSKSNIHPDFTIKLFPGGLYGYGEYLEVFLCSTEPIVFSGDLSLIGSDGTIFYTQHMNSLIAIHQMFPRMLKFEEVVTRIRKNEALHKDQLTLRYRLRRSKETKVYRRTVIEVFDVSFRISPKSLDKLDETGKGISLLQYPCDENGIGQMILDVSKSEIFFSKMLLTLKPDPFTKDIIVLTRTTVLNKDGEVVRTEENDHVFQGEEKWIFSNSMTVEEVVKDKFSLILYLKLIPSNKYKHCFGHFEIHPKMVAFIPTDSLRSPSIRNSEKNFAEKKTSVLSNQPSDSIAVLTDELMCLYQDQDFSDFQLKCRDVTFPVHRNILSARSPVFKTMLSTDMREAASGTLDIVDLEPSTLGLFLTFLYTGGVEDLQGDSALKLYYAADKYQVTALKRECVHFLCSNVSISNVCDILSVANRHQDDKLTGVAHDFFLDNYNEVLGSEGWKNFMRSEPLLAVETVTHFGEKKYVRKSGAV